MHYLSSISQCETRELEAELKDFFVRLRYIRHRLHNEGDRLNLNRLQRSRCKENLLALERIEHDFDELICQEDIPHLYRKVHRYVKLDPDRLMDLFGRVSIARTSLFIALQT